MPALTASLALGYVNLAAGKSITASSSNASFPAANLSDSLLESSVWESANGVLSAIDVTVNLGSLLGIDVVALIGSNGTDSATKRVKLAVGSGFSPTVYDDGGMVVMFNTNYGTVLTPNAAFGRHAVTMMPATVNAQYGRITITDASNADNHLKGSVLWAGPVWQFPLSYDITSEPVRTFSGSPGVERRYKGWKFVVKALTNAQAVELESIVDGKLRTGRYLVIPHPTKPETFLSEVIYCTLVNMKRTYLPIVSGTPWQVEIEFSEVED